MNMELVLKDVHKSFGELKVLNGVNLETEQQRIVCILGPSGCGKTTLLNIISGIVKPDKGEVKGINGKDISYLFQESRLLKWKTVEQNIDFVIKDKMSKQTRKEAVSMYLDMVGLEKYKHYYSEKLSGGMKQRVSLARAFAYPSEILLMDEPFKSLDLQLKMSLISCFIDLWMIDRRTVFFVTHDVREAALLGEDIYVLTQKPTHVKIKIENNIPYSDRDFQNSDIDIIEKKLYHLLTEGHEVGNTGM